tara:strand:+ start:238 stop:465 length:228 start_codon:yes stop_codon:yes gene_type:complete
MGFKANNTKIGRGVQNMNHPSPNVFSLELTEPELELLLITIKNGLFKGEYVETLYNLTLKLQKKFLELKSDSVDE